MKKKILIIGGTGFIGYHLASRCKKFNWDVTSISTKKPTKERRLKKVRYKICNISFKRNLTHVAKYKYDYEKTFKIRYSKICKYIGLKYMSIEADPVNNVKLNPETKKFISKKVLKESNYYKNLLIDVKKFEKVISDF